MNWVDILIGLGAGGILTSVVDWLRNRRKSNVEIEKTDVDTKLAYLGGVIERLEAEVTRVNTDREWVYTELAAEQERSASLRQRVRQLEDEIDGVRHAARENQQRYEALAAQLKELADVGKDDK